MRRNPFSDETKVLSRPDSDEYRSVTNRTGRLSAVVLCVTFRFINNRDSRVLRLRVSRSAAFGMVFSPPVLSLLSSCPNSRGSRPRQTAGRQAVPFPGRVSAAVNEAAGTPEQA